MPIASQEIMHPQVRVSLALEKATFVWTDTDADIVHMAHIIPPHTGHRPYLRTHALHKALIVRMCVLSQVDLYEQWCESDHREQWVEVQACTLLSIRSRAPHCFCAHSSPAMCMFCAGAPI